MYKKIISDIVEYLNFLDKGQYSIYISMPDKALVPYIEKTLGLLPFLSGEPMTNSEVYYSIPLKHNLNTMLWLHIRRKNGKLDEHTANVLATTLRYMFERLFEQCEENTELSSMIDVCKKAVTYIKNNYLKDISVKDVAKELGYSASYFGYCFKKIYNISVNNYILQIRLEKAASLLQNTPHSVSYISEMVGFSGCNYFSTVFKSKFGVTPREYRKTKHNPDL